MNNKLLTITPELAAELETWGKLTARVFGKLRKQANINKIDIPIDQAWYWTDQWQKWEKEADQDLKNGNYNDFDNVDDLIKDLHKQT